MLIREINKSHDLLIVDQAQGAAQKPWEKIECLKISHELYLGPDGNLLIIKKNVTNHLFKIYTAFQVIMQIGFFKKLSEPNHKIVL